MSANDAEVAPHIAVTTPKPRPRCRRGEGAGWAAPEYMLVAAAALLAVLSGLT